MPPSYYGGVSDSSTRDAVLKFLLEQKNRKLLGDQPFGNPSEARSRAGAELAGAGNWVGDQFTPGNIATAASMAAPMRAGLSAGAKLLSKLPGRAGKMAPKAALAALLGGDMADQARKPVAEGMAQGWQPGQAGRAAAAGLTPLLDVGSSKLSGSPFNPIGWGERGPEMEQGQPPMPTPGQEAAVGNALFKPDSSSPPKGYAEVPEDYYEGYIEDWSPYKLKKLHRDGGEVILSSRPDNSYSGYFPTDETQTTPRPAPNLVDPAMRPKKKEDATGEVIPGGAGAALMGAVQWNKTPRYRGTTTEGGNERFSTTETGADDLEAFERWKQGQEQRSLSPEARRDALYQQFLEEQRTQHGTEFSATAPAIDPGLINRLSPAERLALPRMGAVPEGSSQVPLHGTGQEFSRDPSGAWSMTPGAESPALSALTPGGVSNVTRDPNTVEGSQRSPNILREAVQEAVTRPTDSPEGVTGLQGLASARARALGPRAALTAGQAPREGAHPGSLSPRTANPYPWKDCLLYTSPSPRDRTRSRMPSSA